MSKGIARQEVKPQKIETNPPILIDSLALSKKDHLHILHVDDDLCLLDVSKQILSTENDFEVDCALSVDEAVKKMDRRTYDAVISDYEMPMKNGLQFLKELREKKNDVPFILFTGKGREEVAIQALNWGADHYINKNGPPETVYAELTHAIVSSVEKAKAKRQMFYDARLFQNVTEPILATDDKRIIKAWNKAAENLFGWTAKEVTERSVQEVFDSAQIEPPEKLILDELDSRGVFHGEIVRKNKAGLPLDIELSIISLQDKLGKFIGNVAVYHDISQRKKTEEAIRLSEEKYRNLFENASDIILTGDLSGTITSVNEAVKKYGFDKQQVIGRNVREFLSVEDGSRQDEVFRKVSFGKSLSGTLEAPVVIGKMTFEVKTDPLKIGERVVGFQTILRDVTERKEADEKLRESEEKYRDIFENARDAIYVHDLKGKILSINKLVEEYGYTRDQIVGNNMLNFIPKKYWPKLIVQFSQLTRGRQVEGEVEVNTPMGKRNAEYRSNPIIRGNKVIAVHTVLRDTTERKKTEDALLESQQKFKALFSANPEAAVFLDTDFHVIEANSRFSVLFGYSFDEIKGKIITDVIVPDDAKEESRNIRQKVISGPVEAVALRKRKDDSQVPLFMSGGPVVVDGKTIGCIMVYKDISDIITVQEELSNALTKAELLNEKLNVVGGFTRHDVRNKLSTINGNLYLARKYSGDNRQLHECLDQIKTAVSNTVRILDVAKDYEMLGSHERLTLDVGKAVDDAASLFSDLKGVKMVNECRGYKVLADTMLSTVFHNLIDNSLKYGQKITQIKVYIRQNQNKSDSIVYEDDGVGIDSEKKKRLFTRGFGMETGLGLYLIKRTCEIYGWTAQETGEPYKGAQFVFTLPTKQGAE
jgi:PAS domain S-box-containing protein